MLGGLEQVIYLIIATIVLIGILFWIYKVLEMNLADEKKEAQK
jgi:cell division protein FtsL